MTTGERVNQLSLDHLNGKFTLREALWEAYSLGYGNGHDDGRNDAGLDGLPE